KNELSRSSMIFVLEEVMHPQPEIFKAEFAEIFARDRERIEIVFLKVSAKLAPTFLIFAPQKPSGQEQQRYDDRCDDVDCKFALQRFDHGMDIFSSLQPAACGRLWE